MSFKNFIVENLCIHRIRDCFLMLHLVVFLSPLTLFAEKPADKIFQTPVTIRGVVYSDKQVPLEGVSVTVKNRPGGVMTNAAGEFSIQTNSENTVLVFSSVGYVMQEVPVSSQQNVSVVLQSATGDLGEVVITGYTSQAKRDITGSVAVVDVKSLKSIPSGSVTQALQGQAAGVTVITSGAPGGRNDIFIRGVTSFGNTQPLIIIDGVQGSMENLNFSDIESMQVLKDAGAASIYGVRGSNGVIIITTKRGKSGDPKISVESYVGLQIPPSGNVFNLMNSEDFAATVKLTTPGTELFRNGLPDYTYAGPNVSGTAMEGDPAIDPALYNFDLNNPENDYLIQKINKVGTNWFDEIFNTAPIQSHSLTASGGTNKSNYLFSIGYFNQQGTLIETYLKRYSVRLNTHFKPHKNIRLGENAFIYYRQNPGFGNQSEGNAISHAYRIMPVIPVRDIKGNYGGTWLGPEFGEGENAVAIQEETRDDKDNNWVINGNIYAEVDLLKNLTIRSSFGGTIDNGHEYSVRRNRYHSKQDHFSENGFSESSRYSSSYTWTNTATYSLNFTNHRLVVLAGSEGINNYGRGVGGSANNFFSLDPDYLILGNGTSSIDNFSTAYSNSLFSLFGRVDYSFQDKYLFAATVRRDGSSVFGSNKRYGVFPSFSAGWRVSEEGFMKDVAFINDLKLKGSYGILGSQANVSPSNAFSLYGGDPSNSYYDIGGTGNSSVQGFRQIRIGNAGTGWEENIVTNFGVDATLFQNRLSLSVEWYKKAIDGLLFPLPLPSTAGGAIAPTINIGDIQNKGIDLLLTYRGGQHSQLSYAVSLNAGTYKNKVVSIPEPGYFDVAGSRIGTLVRNQVGQSVGSFFGYDVVGLFRDDADVSASPTQIDAEPGRFKYRDVDNDKAITPDDRTFFGDPNPDFVYGLNLSFAYKGFDLSAVLYGSQGNDVMNLVKYYTDFMGTSVGRAKSNVLLNAWTPQNTSSSIPKLEAASSFSTNGVINSYYLEDGSFLKMRSLILGYNIAPKLLTRAGVQRIRLYVQGANLFTISGYDGIDPELTGNLGGTNASAAFGIDYGNYPSNQKSLIVGCNIDF